MFMVILCRLFNLVFCKLENQKIEMDTQHKDIYIYNYMHVA